MYGDGKEPMDDFDMKDIKSRLTRTARQNLNSLLDRIKEFEERGGLNAIFDEGDAPEGFEHIGNDPQPHNYSPPKSATEKTLRDYYANLEVEYGADLDTVKASYRRLMRKYHPDRFAHDENMQELSTELTQELTRAYQAIESYIKTGKY